jgi:hypothetical protein
MDSLKGPHEGLAELPVARVMQLEDGEHQAGVTINFKPSSTRFLKIANDPPYPYQVRVMRRIELLSGEVSTVSVHRKPEIDAQVERAISVNVSVDQVRKRLIVSVNNAGAPIDLAFQGQLSAGKLQRDLGFILFPANRPGNVTIPLNDVLQVWDPQQVDIELMPSLDAAEHTLDIFDIWGGHVSRVGVPVK